MDGLAVILQPLGLLPSGYQDGYLFYNILGAYQGRLWIEVGDDKVLLCNGREFAVCNGDQVRVPESLQGCPREALTACCA